LFELKEYPRSFEELNDSGGTSEINHRLAIGALEQGETLLAEQYLRRSIAAGRDTGNKTTFVWPTLHLVRLLAGRFDLPAARLPLGEAHAALDELALDPTSDPVIAQSIAALDQIVAVPNSLDQNAPR